MAIRYTQYKTDSAAIGSIITWPGQTIPDGYIACDGATYTITASSNLQYRSLASIITTLYNAADTYPTGSDTGTGTFTVPNMNVDDVVIGKDGSNNVGSRIGSNTAAFGETQLSIGQWPQHFHSLPRQNFTLTNSLGVTNNTTHGGAITNAPRCPNGPACMAFVVFRGRVPCLVRPGGPFPPCAPGGTSNGPAQAGSSAALGPAVTFNTTMGNAGSANPSTHSHSTNPVQPTVRMLFLIKAF